MRLLLAALLLVVAAGASAPVLAQANNEVNVAADDAAANLTGNAAANGAANVPVPAQRSSGTTEVTPPNPQNGPGVLPESGQTIVKLFVLAALLESALALLFNWRPFVVTLDGRAVKPLLTFIAALVLVFAFGLDDLEELLEAYGSSPITGDGERVSQILEAMIIAGGSSGVNSLLRTLGFRAIPAAQIEQKPPPTEAWLSVGLTRVNAVGPVQVVTTPGGELGTIHGTMRKPGLASFFLQDKGKLPQSGGKPVAPGVEIQVKVVGFNATGEGLTSTPQEVTPAPGALIDLEFKL